KRQVWLRGRRDSFTCSSARQSRFCTDFNCALAGQCWNFLSENPALAIDRSLRIGVVAMGSIPAGKIIGQDLGKVQVFGPPRRNGRIHKGYRIHLEEGGIRCDRLRWDDSFLKKCVQPGSTVSLGPDGNRVNCRHGHCQ
ncbi:hypothetical protein GN958_ATG15807, partial [Phytophthora infestans]